MEEKFKDAEEKVSIGRWHMLNFYLVEFAKVGWS
jgi:hypothetical protein